MLWLARICVGGDFRAGFLRKGIFLWFFLGVLGGSSPSLSIPKSLRDARRHPIGKAARSIRSVVADRRHKFAEGPLNSRFFFWRTGRRLTFPKQGCSFEEMVFSGGPPKKPLQNIRRIFPVFSPVDERKKCYRQL